MRAGHFFTYRPLRFRVHLFHLRDFHPHLCNCAVLLSYWIFRILPLFSSPIPYNGDDRLTHLYSRLRDQTTIPNLYKISKIPLRLLTIWHLYRCFTFVTFIPAYFIRIVVIELQVLLVLDVCFYAHFCTYEQFFVLNERPNSEPL